jgi:hypothetical protein
MKIDMSPEAITRRLEEVEELREACLALANSSAGRLIRQKHPENPVVQRTSQAIGAWGDSTDNTGGKMR